MATLTRCANGHFFDSSKYRTCPYCDQSTGGGDTTPLEPAKVVINPEPQVIRSEGETVGFYDEVIKFAPVVGWLVSIEGSTCGKDFRLCSGKNYVGRSQSMDVVLEDDNYVSRDKHAIIVFDPVSQKTLCQAGESRELFYLNGNVVTDTVELQRGDILTIGKTKLKFVPFCGDLHNWNA